MSSQDTFAGPECSRIALLGPSVTLPSLIAQTDHVLLPQGNTGGARRLREKIRAINDTGDDSRITSCRALRSTSRYIEEPDPEGNRACDSRLKEIAGKCNGDLVVSRQLILHSQVGKYEELAVLDFLSKVEPSLFPEERTWWSKCMVAWTNENRSVVTVISLNLRF